MGEDNLTMELTVNDVNNLIHEIEKIRHGLDVNSLTENEREDARYFLAQYIAVLRNSRVITR